MFLIDWLSFTTKIDSLESIIDYLGIENAEFQAFSGFYGYRDSLRYEGINIHYNGYTEDMGILVEMSGKGCRTYENNTKYKIIHTEGKTVFTRIFEDILFDTTSYNITRLDIAFDDIDGVIPIKKLGKDVTLGNYVSSWRDWTVEQSSKGFTVVLGSQKSDCYMRIYDKAAEQGIANQKWIRLELQLRQNRAFEFIKLLQTQDIGSLWTGVVANYIRFLKPNISDSNKSRWSTAAYWQKLLNNAAKVKLYNSPPVEYNIHKLSHYVLKQAGGALKTYASIFGGGKLLDDIDENKIKLNPKYELLIKEYKRYES